MTCVFCVYALCLCLCRCASDVCKFFFDLFTTCVRGV